MFSSELVVHSPDWATGSFVFAGNQGDSPVWSEPVVHFPEWSTGSFVFARNQGYSPVLTEPVVHWLLCFCRKPGKFAGLP